MKRSEFLLKNQNKEENHICQISKQIGHWVWPNLAFLHMTFKDLGCANCQNCFVKQKEYCDKNNLTFCELFQKEIYSDLICDIHIKNTTSEESNVINMYKEEKHFEFQEYCFLDDNLQLLENIVSKIIHYPYAG